VRVTDGHSKRAIDARYRSLFFLPHPLLPPHDEPPPPPQDPDPTKVGLQVGAYRGDDGKPLVLDAVREAEKRVYENALNHEYAGIAGVPEFNQLSLKFACV
jgi:hypothetical protein